MKLIYCPRCYDVVKLISACQRSCECGDSYGYYEDDGLHAVYWGSAIPLGFDNRSLVKAIMNQPDVDMGECFEAFVVPKSCRTFKRR